MTKVLRKVGADAVRRTGKVEVKPDKLRAKVCVRESEWEESRLTVRGSTRTTSYASCTSHT